jgi:hypothetical protein
MKQVTSSYSRLQVSLKIENNNIVDRPEAGIEKVPGSIPTIPTLK